MQNDQPLLLGYHIRNLPGILAIPLGDFLFLALFLQFSVSKDFVDQEYYLKYIVLCFSRDLWVKLIWFSFAECLT